MNIICPNCDAEYLFQPRVKELVGQNLQCSQCEQKWFQYNLYNEIETNQRSSDTLKIMADEEQKISEGKVITKTVDERDKTYDTVKTRLQDSSERLKKSKRRLVENTSEPPNKARLLDQSTTLGFSIVSLIFISLTTLYIFSNEAGNLFPQIVEPLENYVRLVDNVIGAVQDLISLCFEFVR
jgi:hypothetical protein